MAEPNFKAELLALMKREDLGNKSVSNSDLDRLYRLHQRLAVPLLTYFCP